ncbi:hypothetical protein QTP70_010020 [Hemibagrus guttatus]|uniref:Uncharacterized protein n=1 Tax=Hemibagrus guttatus TaxID=175788 RepID=A0AAE0QK33_9TELE|nr:hypothetical protein QTP70_010020 [Hemibagrus guttatus]
MAPRFIRVLKHLHHNKEQSTFSCPFDFCHEGLLMNVFLLYSSSHSEVDLLVCFRSLSCCRTQVRFSLRSPIYQSGKGYKAISKALGLSQTTVRAIIYKRQKHGTVENLPRSGWLTRITPRAQRQLIQEVTRDPTTTSKELQASLASVKLPWKQDLMNGLSFHGEM